MSGTSVIKTVPTQDLLTELRTFLSGATRTVKINPLELARTALSLLKTLPAARDAVLEYFCSLFDDAVSKYVTQIETDMTHGSSSGSLQEEATIAEIHNILCNFVSANPEAWAPIISTWSLELLGELSSRYAGRAHVPLSAGLNETLQLWMSCRATRTLIDITTQCLSCLMHTDPEACINALLDTSVAHSPHFDWVVAHVGSCFPHTVITRVLSCGLKDFCQHGSVEQGAKAPKLLSVVGILGHLAGSHFVDIKNALLELFKWSLEPGGPEDKAQRCATVPFLLQLASLSPMLLRALTSDVLHTLNLSMLPQLSSLAPAWCQYFGGDKALKDLIVHLVRSCEQGGTQIFMLLLDAACPPEEVLKVDKTVTTTSREILGLLLQEMDLLMRSTGHSKPVPLLDAVKSDVSSIQPLLLSSDILRVQYALRLLGLLGYRSPIVLVNTASYLLQRASTEEHLVALVGLVTDGICSLSTSLSVPEEDKSEWQKNLAHALEQAIRGVEDPLYPAPPEQLWLNVATLLRWESTGRVKALHGRLITTAMRVNLRKASELLQSPPNPLVAHAVAKALDLLDVPGNSVQLTLKWAKATVAYFFLCVTETDSLVRIRGVRVCCRLLSRLSLYSSAARALALRELLEGSLFQSQSWLFGGAPKTKQNKAENVRLLPENHKQGTISMLTHHHSSVFHAGVIGNGPQRPQHANKLHKDMIVQNTELLMLVLTACCRSPPAPGEQLLSSTPSISLEAITTVSLLLVELISPDVMYNGLPWPEEEFCKVTIERDLHIRQVFDNVPLAWELITLVATHRPALCYSSVLLRALTATLMAQWGSWQRHNVQLLDTTVRVLEVLALGQLLPPPLASLRDIVPHLKAQEVVQILRDCVWNYLRDHVPSPALFTRDSTGLTWRDSSLARPGSQYTDTLRFILQNNIDELGYLYFELFVANK
ncbi:integrator complex subunit 5 isoform X2 [Anabrus simplex]